MVRSAPGFADAYKQFAALEGIRKELKNIAKQRAAAQARGASSDEIKTIDAKETKALLRARAIYNRD